MQGNWVQNCFNISRPSCFAAVLFDNLKNSLSFPQRNPLHSSPHIVVNAIKKVLGNFPVHSRTFYASFLSLLWLSNEMVLGEKLQLMIRIGIYKDKACVAMMFIPCCKTWPYDPQVGGKQ